MSKAFFNLLLLSGLLYVSCSQPSASTTTNEQDGLAAFNQDSLAIHISMLASG